MLKEKTKDSYVTEYKDVLILILMEHAQRVTLGKFADKTFGVS